MSVIAEDLRRAQDGGEQQFPQRLQPPCRAATPVGQRRAIEVDAVAGIDPRLAVERQAVGVLGDNDLGNQRLGRHAAGDQTLRRRSLDDRLGAGPATVARAPGDPDPQAQRDHVELLGDVLIDHVQRAAAAWAGLVGDVDNDLVALQMGRQVTAVALRRASS